MRAVVCRSYGGPEVAELADVPIPDPGPGEVRIRVKASSVNRTDCGIRAASPPIARLVYGLRRPRRPILGTEYAGVVDAAGPGVERFAVGDRVFGFDDAGSGGHAEYVVKRAEGMIAEIPDGLGFDQAAVATEGAHYAGTDLRAADVGPGTRVLVYGASGAIGSAAVQLAAHLGAEVTAVCGTDAVEVVRGLGPDRVVDYLAEDVTAIDGSFHLVFDAVGKRSYRSLGHLLAPDGWYVSTELGRGAQNPMLALAGRLPRGPRVRFPIPRAGWRSMALIVEALEAGTFRPVIDRVCPMDEIVEAYRYVETGRKIGGVVLDVDLCPPADR